MKWIATITETKVYEIEVDGETYDDAYDSACDKLTEPYTYYSCVSSDQNIEIQLKCSNVDDKLEV